MKSLLIYASLLLFLVGCEASQNEAKTIEITTTERPPVVDGQKNDSCWQSAPTFLIDKAFSGQLPHASDYMGKIKIASDSNYIYILGEVYDDSLVYADSSSLGDHFEFTIPNKDSLNPKLLVFEALLNQSLVVGNTDSITQAVVAASKIAVTKSDKTVIVEIAIKKLPAFTENYLNNGKELLFAVTYSDFDKAGTRDAIMANVEKKAMTGAQAGWVLTYSKVILHP